LSISDTETQATDFDRWLAAEFARSGAFTALVVLVSIGAGHAVPLCSTYFHVTGIEADWPEMVLLFAGAGREWNAAGFFPMAVAGGGALDNPTARLCLQKLEASLDADPAELYEGHFFDTGGKQLEIGETPPQ